MSNAEEIRNKNREASIGFAYKNLNSDTGKSWFSKQEWLEAACRGLGLKGEVRNRHRVKATPEVKREKR